MVCYYYLWYLSDEHAILLLFDDTVRHKKNVAEAVKTRESTDSKAFNNAKKPE